ncbi:MAG TPA: hypothetical protein VEA41_02785, partial [Salinarimonas sp.]|nr:hypothetical protein [Salinarimonas sp.]
ASAGRDAASAHERCAMHSTPDPYSNAVEKVLLLAVFAAGCVLCGHSLAGDRERSGSGIGGGHNRGSHFGLGGFLSPTPKREPSAAAGGSAERKQPPKDKDEKKPEVKKITEAK